MYSKSLVPQKNNYSVAVNTASNECIISIDLNFSMGGNIVGDSKFQKFINFLKSSKGVSMYFRNVFIYNSEIMIRRSFILLSVLLFLKGIKDL